MSLSYPGHNLVESVLDKEQQCLRSFLNKLINNNNVCNILAQREIGGYRNKQRNFGISYNNSYNFKQRRFIIIGKDCFTQMWKVADIVYTVLREKGLLANENNDSVSYSKTKKNIESANRILLQSGRQPTTKFIRRHCNLLNIKDQIHIIEQHQRLDNTDIERINKCFLLIIIDYSNNHSDNIRGNREYYLQNNRILEQIVREDNLDPDFLNVDQDVHGLDHNSRSINTFVERVIPELLTLYNSEAEETVSVFNKNICYVSARKVLHHNSWINITDYQ